MARLMRLSSTVMIVALFVITGTIAWVLTSSVGQTSHIGEETEEITLGWIVLFVFLAIRLIYGLLVPVDALLIVAVGYAIGAGTLLLFGSPDRTPTRRDVAAVLSRHGFDVDAVQAACVEDGSSRHFSVWTADGHRIFVKVRSSEERAAEILFRIYRMLARRQRR